ncbi:MAG TPA: DUF3151 family protein [Acidimicrobiales bacterium]|nr:DUF3151 family protein [Acidimicrobiales bacterium]
MTQEHPVTFTPHAQETVLAPITEEQRAALQAAAGDQQALRRVAARWPTLLQAWAQLAETADDPISSYAFARVGYHRGLDSLRHSGWRGSGLVRADRDENLGFLCSLEALRAAASAIGEVDEAERCEQFLYQCDPDWRRVLGG